VAPHYDRKKMVGRASNILHADETEFLAIG
jgi:hypothetical protein